ncbi:uncharacterized protein [Zea mays]|uniref:uncharacterized protein n=1 Tax=Zea mays TaxID=4577 RepID=UPI0004DE7B71|nr:uncharacterized protein LOC111589985 [Zea mays]|eukprot:XP_023156697.1 uncharacterized protein LOC111589985 [Zea mays]
MFRMNASLFYQLHDILVNEYGLTSSMHMNSMEPLAIFLVTCGHSWSNTCLQNKFKHSGETITRKFMEVLCCVVSMSNQYIRPKDPNFRNVHSRIRNDPRMWAHFKDCIGAIDGTHICANPPPQDFLRYLGRFGKATQNVMAVVDFDMRFTFASIGQPGSMHDTSVLYNALQIDEDIFPHSPLGNCIFYLSLFISYFRNYVDVLNLLGKYYVVDAGYPNRPGYLLPYKGQRYHVPEWRRGPAPSGEQEMFNHLHSSLRNVVEHVFGVWKMKWRILLNMSKYPMVKQKMIVAATMCLHNFIRQHHALDKDFERCDRDQDYVPTIPARYRNQALSQSSSDTTSHANDRTMDRFCDDLALAISSSRT